MYPILIASENKLSEIIPAHLIAPTMRDVHLEHLQDNANDYFTGYSHRDNTENTDSIVISFNVSPCEEQAVRESEILDGFLSSIELSEFWMCDPILNANLSPVERDKLLDNLTAEFKDQYLEDFSSDRYFLESQDPDIDLSDFYHYMLIKIVPHNIDNYDSTIVIVDNDKHPVCSEDDRALAAHLRAVLKSTTYNLPSLFPHVLKAVSIRHFKDPDQTMPYEQPIEDQAVYFCNTPGEMARKISSLYDTIKI